MKKQLAILTLAVAMIACNNPKPEESAQVEAKPKQPVDIGDDNMSKVCKDGLAALASGDINAFTSAFADNAVYRFNNGDSIAGKPAIVAYWTDRRSNMIESISFANDIWLVVNVNEKTGVMPGTWVLGWYQTTAKYKPTGKSMSQSIHTDYHFDKDGKIDAIFQYLDRDAINKALTK